MRTCLLCLALTVAISGCNPPPGAGGDLGGGGDDLSTDDLGGGNPVFDVEPSTLQTITVTLGQTMPTVPYTATFGGQPVNAAWSLDRGDVATLDAGPASSSVFTPRGTVAALVTLSAGYNGQVLRRQVQVNLTGSQNGADPTNPLQARQIPANVGALSSGGGVGGVGGEGLGGTVDSATAAVLANPVSDGSAQGFTLLYPYDQTVWPRGMLAPLLMWKWSGGDADAVQIELATTSGSFSWKGIFSRPAILATTGGPFIRHPIPQNVWDAATNSAGAVLPNGSSDKLVIKLTIARNGAGYGPLTHNWVVAPARLTGTVYYNSYGTQLVKNWVNTDKAGNPIGAAILSVRTGDVAPNLVVGQNSPLGTNGIPTNDSGCRVCHVVSARGRWLLTQSEQGTPGDGRSFLYDLTASNVQASVAQLATEGVFAWAAMTADGSYALTNTINPSSTNPAIGVSQSGFYGFSASPVAQTLTGLPPSVAAGYPTYSPDDKFVSYIDVTGQTGNIHGPLVVASYDPMARVFSNVATLATPPNGQRYGYPAFLPDNSGLLFEDQVRTSLSDTVMVTRNGARSQLAWVNRTGTPTVTSLDQLNGKGYVPIGPNNHGIAGATDPRSSYNETGFDDTTLNYEPTVLPIVAGGYAWVVFTSRRLYGNQLTAVPYQSWPPDYNTRDLGQATVKKLWVAAINLNAPAGSDPSHPAFYLPAQEILAGNSRGFWVLDPCRTDGTSCDTGDQCCNGYCEPNGAGGALVCSNTPPNAQCSKVQEKCMTAADCCDPTNLCTAGFCAAQVIP